MLWRARGVEVWTYGERSRDRRVGERAMWEADSKNAAAYSSGIAPQQASVRSTRMH